MSTGISTYTDEHLSIAASINDFQKITGRNLK